MLAKLASYSLFGIQALPVEVEVDISPAALPKTILVGLAETAVKESIHRTERALVNTGYSRPIERVVINLSPAEFPKEAAAVDLPIALGMLTASGQLPSDRFAQYAAVGELALDGTVRPVRGALAMAIAAREQGRTGLVVPAANAQEAAVVEGIEIIAVGSLAEAVGWYNGQLDIEPTPFSWSDIQTQFGGYDIDYSDVKGQETAKRAVTVAAAGGHHLLMLGSPGTGKTLLARCLATGAGARFVHVRSTDVTSKWYGEAERQLQAVFDDARTHVPTVLFFDELDAVAPVRDDSHEATHRIVSTLLVNLDGLEDVHGVIVVGAKSKDGSHSYLPV